jgi:hypothetical protein
MKPKMFEDFEEMHEIIEKAEYKAVHAGALLGGLSIEAFQKGDDCILRVITIDENNDIGMCYARITEDDFDDLSMATEWRNCGATSMDDVAITVAAMEWVKKNTWLKFFKFGLGPKNGKMIPSDFSL